MTTIQWVDAAGKRTPLTANGGYAAAHLSPDGKRIAASITSVGSEDIRIYDLQRETWTDLTFGAGRFYYSPVWSPDSQSVFFGSLSGMVWARADGASRPQSFTQGLIQYPTSIAPDGKRIAFTESINGISEQVFTASLETTGGQWKAGMPEEFFPGAGTVPAGSAAFSPDGKWLAYQSNSSGTNEVYVRAFPDSGSQWKVSTNGGLTPIWSRSGHELFYQSGDQEMAVSYSVQGNTFIVEKPRVWLAKVGGFVSDLSPDSKRLLALFAADSPDAPKADHEVVLLQNFVDDLRRRVPAGK
jgi:serine/threonine-protein kinase